MIPARRVIVTPLTQDFFYLFFQRLRWREILQASSRSHSQIISELYQSDKPDCPTKASPHIPKEGNPNKNRKKKIRTKTRKRARRTRNQLTCLFPGEATISSNIHVEPETQKRPCNT